jgi:peroxin-7
LEPDTNCVARYPTQDALYDLCHSETHSAQILTSSGDGSLRLFDTSLEPTYPIAVYAEHGREAFSCAWNLVSKNTFASSSWDGTVKVWNPERERSLLTLPTHSCTYSAQWSPHTEGLLSAVSSDSHLRLWDLRTPASASNHLQLSIPIHEGNPLIPSSPPSEALSHDWNKYRPTTLAVAGVDRTIRTFDIRHPGHGPSHILPGHAYAVRKLAWSPHLADRLLSASYDMTCRVWSVDSGAPSPSPSSSSSRELAQMDRHTEFVTGVDWCLFGAEGWAASCAWDERVCVWDARALVGPGQ